MPPELQIPYPKTSGALETVVNASADPSLEVLPPKKRLYFIEYIKNKSYLFLWLFVFFTSFIFSVLQFFETRKLAQTSFIYEKSFYNESYRFFKDRIWYAIEIGVEHLSWDILMGGLLFLSVLLLLYPVIFFVRKRKQINFLESSLFLFTHILIGGCFLLLILFGVVLGTVESLVQSQYAKVESYEKLLIQESDIVSKKEVISEILQNTAEPIEVFDDTSFLFREKKGLLSFVDAYAVPFALSGINKKLEEIYTSKDLPYLYYPQKGMLVINQKKFITDLGYPIAEKYLEKKFSQYKRPKIETYKVLEKEEYKPFYMQAEVSRLEDYIEENKRIFNENLNVIKERTQILSGIAKRMLDEDVQYKIYVTEKEKEYATSCKRATLLNGCDGLRRSIERDKKTIAENRDAIAFDRKDALLNIENGKRFNEEIKVAIAKTTEEIRDLRAGSSKDLIAESQSENAAGNFFTPSTIIIRYFNEDIPLKTKDYVEIINHEILHYYADLHKGETVLPTFLDEGLTEYFSTISFGYSGKEFYDTLSYPLEVRVVEFLLKRIPLEDLRTVYFYHDLPLFQTLLQKSFPEVSYASFEALGMEMTNASWLSDEYVADYDESPLILSMKQLLFGKEEGIMKEK